MTAQKWLLIDFDNTMMATEQYAVPSLIARFNELYAAQAGRALTLAEFREHFHGQAREVLCESLSRHFGIPVDYPALYQDREWRMLQHLQGLDGGVQMADGLIETLTALKAQGWGFAFVSNNPIQRALAAMRYAANGRGGELAALFGCHFFEAGDVQKPRPDVYLRAMQQLGAAPAQCAAVEDSPSGAAAAVAAGLATYGFTGFGDDGAAAKLRAAGCRDIIDHWTALPALLQAQACPKQAPLAPAKGAQA